MVGRWPALIVAALAAIANLVLMLVLRGTVWPEQLLDLRQTVLPVSMSAVLGFAVYYAVLLMKFLSPVTLVLAAATALLVGVLWQIGLQSLIHVANGRELDVESLLRPDEILRVVRSAVIAFVLIAMVPLYFKLRRFRSRQRGS